MNNPLKIAPQIVPPKTDVQIRVSSSNGPLKLSPDLIELFAKTQKEHEESVKTGIQNGTLDRHGNPAGTQYWDPDEPNPTIKRQRIEKDKRRKIKIKPGDIFGDLTVLKRGPRIKAARPNLQERWRCRCSCGKELIVPKYYLIRKPNPKTHCGHKTATLKSKNPREYRIYMMIHQRCYNPRHESYEHYSSRGIGLFDEWRNDLHPKDGFKKFLEHVGPAPSQWHSLDRIHNSRGYIPGNLRWATAKEQRANQGDRIGGLTSEEIADMGLTEDEFIEKILRGEIQ